MYLAARPPVQQKRDEKRSRKLRIREPDRVERIALFHGKHINENGAGAAKKDIHGRGVLEAKSLFEKRRAKFERQPGCDVQHGGRPFPGVADERDARMLHHLASGNGVPLRAVRSHQVSLFHKPARCR